MQIARAKQIYNCFETLHIAITYDRFAHPPNQGLFYGCLSLALQIITTAKYRDKIKKVF